MKNRANFVRFVVQKLDTRSGRRQGIFQVAYQLNRGGNVAVPDSRDLDNLLVWFDENLKRPKRLALSSRANAKAQAIGWFKDTAAEHISKMHQIARLLEKYGVQVEMITTKRPGYVVFEDDYQIAAYPFSETKT